MLGVLNAVVIRVGPALRVLLGVQHDRLDQIELSPLAVVDKSGVEQKVAKAAHGAGEVEAEYEKVAAMAVAVGVALLCARAVYVEEHVLIEVMTQRLPVERQMIKGGYGV
jgi:hypothetical protein